MIARVKDIFTQFTTSDEKPKIHKFGTFGGVFTPDVLTILGVIMYLRLGWVVGNAGFVGTVVIILFAKAITICTGLSISSITTNIKIGAGGAYSIISQSLGLEAGGSIGVPLYIAQTLSAALYVIGFTEGWIKAFPSHDFILVAMVASLALLTISYISTAFAIRIQYIVMGIMALSILSFLFSPRPPNAEIVYIGNFEDATFWEVFAIYFPAVTGIMAGANMSGDLKNPRRAIPVGTMSSIFITMIIYIAMAYVAALIGTPDELRANQMFMVDSALWGPIIIAGILGATFSSALGSMLGAPRLLQALAEHKTIPFYKILAAKTKTNEPRNATIFTGVIIIISILVADLNKLASLITMFFLITYGVLNLVVFIQQSMHIISFRPTFEIPRFVSLFGALGCLFMMLLIDPIFSGVGIVIIILLYVWFARRELDAEWGDIRGGMFLVLAERASRLAERFPKHQISWKPDLLIPVEKPSIWAGPLMFIRSMTYPSGSIFAFTITAEELVEEKQLAMDELLAPLQSHILVNSVVIEEEDFLIGSKVVIQTLRGGAFRPNTLFLTMGYEEENDSVIKNLTNIASKCSMGVIILHQHIRMAFGMQQNINLWLRDKSPNKHLAILIALHIRLNWEGKINLITVAGDDSDKEYQRLYAFLEHISSEARLPSMTELYVLPGPFEETLKTAPHADINILGLSPDTVPIKFIRKAPELVKSSCIFVRDSGHESALV
ncbi:MAG: hypothetical protein B6242_08535 [Anaerolineaceae bacterium 4572_78]|nr:MAG: hypothetical protein B6242_08535 [Anaerolineaceae bacterium 4572_78]